MDGIECFVDFASGYLFWGTEGSKKKFPHQKILLFCLSYFDTYNNKNKLKRVKRHLADQSKSSVYKSDLNPSSIRKIFSLVYCSGSGSGFVPFFVFWMSKLQRQPQLLRQLPSPEVLA